MHQRKAIAETLAWLEEMGNEEAIGETPVNRYEELKSAKTSGLSEPHTPRSLSRQNEGLSPQTGVGNSTQDTAHKALSSLSTLADLKDYILSFSGCGLKKTALNTVFSDGNPRAHVMLIGEAPGADEDRQGLPFVGASGQLLTKAFEAAGFQRDKDLYITNMIPWRPPGNRQPTPNELALCLPFVRKHIELISPKVIVLVGNTATKALLNTTKGITQLRGQWQTYENEGLKIPALPLYHPAFLLRSPSRKRDVWFDLLGLKRRLQEMSS